MKPGHDDHPVRLDPGPLRPLEPGDGLDPAVPDDDLAGSLAIGGRVDQPGPADLEAGDGPADLIGRRSTVALPTQPPIAPARR